MRSRPRKGRRGVDRNSPPMPARPGVTGQERSSIPSFGPGSMSAAHRDLPLTATHWGTYRAEVHEGRLSALHGFEEDADPSPIGQGMVDTLDDPCRIPLPMVRKGGSSTASRRIAPGAGRSLSSPFPGAR